MNPHTGDIHHFDNEEERKRIEKKINAVLIDVPRKSLEEIEEMSLVQRKAWAKRERKRLRRLEERARLRRLKGIE